MTKTEIVDLIYKHIGRSEDLESLTELGEEIARISAEEEREACKAECIDFSFSFAAGSKEREALQRVAVRLDMRPDTVA